MQARGVTHRVRGSFSHCEGNTVPRPRAEVQSRGSESTAVIYYRLILIIYYILYYIPFTRRYALQE